MTGIEHLLGAEWTSINQIEDKVVFSFVDERAMICSQLTHTDLVKRTHQLSSVIAAKTGSVPTVLLMCGDPQRFLEVFLSCLSSGKIPIVLPMDKRTAKAIPQLVASIGDCPLLLDARAEKVIGADRGFLGHCPRHLIEDLSDHDPKLDGVSSWPSANQEAFRILSFQGNASLCHSYSWEAVVKGLSVLSQDWRLREGQRYYSWLPLDNHMGLLAGLLLPLFMKGHGFLGETEHFIGNTAHWPLVVSKYRIEVSGGPDSAYVASERVVAQNGSPFLNSWKTAWNAGEPHSGKALVGKGFAAAGLSADSIVLGYWPKESTCAFSLNRQGAVSGNSLLILDAQGRLRSTAGVEGRFCLLDDTRLAMEYRGGSLEQVKSESFNSEGGKFASSQGYGTYGPTGFHYSIREENRKIPIGVEANPESVKTNSQNKIAIIGAAGIFPGSRDLEEFWTNLESGENSISKIPEDRWDSDALDGSPDNESFVANVKWGGFAPGFDTFDADFFGLSPKEAQYMDPMQRKLLEVTWAAFEDAGMDISRLSGKKIAVFVGIGSFDYMQIMVESGQYIHSYAATGTVQCMAANRISYMFDFKGPSEAIDTACSSSMVALHRAKRSLESGECELAVVAGANALFSPNVYVSLCNAGMLSEDGKCKAFADGANGYVRGEGVGAVILKLGSEASRDGNPVRAYLLGAAVNHGGRTASLTAPSPIAQAEVIEEALKAAGIGPETITYIEAHGTGTDLGDPIEIEGLKRAFNRSRPDQPWQKTCSISSAKTNIGHLEAAAGIAGVIKVILSMKYGRIPAHLHLTKLNPQISLDKTPFLIAERTTDWGRLKIAGQEIPRRAGISSFGFGGVNGHAILEESARGPVTKQVGGNNTRETIFLSARSPEALDRYVDKYVRFLEENAFELDLTSLAHTLRIGRQFFDYRLAITVESCMELLELLKAFSQDKKTALALWPRLLRYGNVSQTQEHVEIIESFTGIEELIDDLMQSEADSTLADLWVAGYALDWSRYPGKHTVVGGLPTYPFAPTRHWLPVTPKQKSGKVESKDPGELFKIDWTESPLPVSRNSSAEGEFVYIVLCDETGVGDRLLDHLIAIGQSFHAIYPMGKALPRAGKNGILQLASDSPDSWNDALEELIFGSKSLSQSKLRLIDLRGLDFQHSEGGDNYRPEELDRKIMETFLPFVSRLILSQGKGAKISFLAAVSGLQTLNGLDIRLEYAGLWGYCRTLVLEQPELFRAIVDIGDSASFVPENLMREFEGQPEDSEIVFREGIRCVPRLVPVEVSDVSSDPSPVSGTHIITGGLGSLGLHVAGWLAAKGASRVVLIGRRPIDQLSNSTEVLGRISAIEAIGTEVIVKTADVAEESAISAIIHEYSGRKELSSVYHLAGSYTNVLVEDMRIDSYTDVVAPKIRGTMNIFRALNGADQVPLVLFSSCASVWGSSTGAHYGAANHFLDMFSAFASAKGLTVKCVNWGGMWKDSGMVPVEHVARFEAIGIKYTSPKQGLEILDRFLESKDIQWIVASVNLEKFIPVMNGNRTCGILQSVAKLLASNQDDRSAQGDFDISGLDGDAKRERVAIALEGRLSSILGLEPSSFDRKKGFFDMGLDSLSSIDFKKRIKGSLGVDISTTVLFDHNTINSLSRFIVDEFFTQEADSQDLHFPIRDFGDKSYDLESMDEDELISMLESELS